MNTCLAVDVWIHVFSTSAPVGREWSVSRPGRFNPVLKASSPRIHRIRGWVGPRAGMDYMDK
jgi:hypothetical protein